MLCEGEGVIPQLSHTNTLTQGGKEDVNILYFGELTKL